MPISDYLQDLRAVVGTRLLLCPGVVGVIHDEAGRILLMLSAERGRWGFPAGAIDPGEAPAQALVREVFEETGLVVRPVQVLGIFGGPALLRTRYPNGDEAEYTAIVFRCRVVGGHLEPRDGEAVDLRWCALDELPPLAVPYPLDLSPSPRSAAVFEWSEAWLEGLGEEG